LQPTLINATRTSFYRQLWEGRNLDSITLDSLAELPLVRKVDLRKAGPAAQLPGQQVCDELLSSGTTGKPFITLRGQREQQRIAELFKEMNSERSTRLIERGLQIQNPQHGTQVSVPAAIRLHSVSVYDRYCFTYAVRALVTTFDEPGVEPRCTMIVASERCLRAFVQYLRAKEISFDRDQPRYAVTFGHYVSQHLRNQVRRILGAVIVDRFSLSEVFGGATENPSDGWYTFDPLIVPEVIDLTDGRPLAEGTGELVLTALYPFQECQPIVRYATGDLVSVTHRGEMFPGELSIKPRGRLAFAVISTVSRELLLSAVDLYESIDCLDWPSRTPVFRDAREVIDPYGLGDPRYDVQHSVERSKDFVHVRIEAADDRERGEDTLRAQRVRENLLSRSPLLRGSVVQGGAELKVSVVDHLEASWAV
jgi:phenylacetate-coenzyme A ligase PaaK-like adenylate-forming protein